MKLVGLLDEDFVNYKKPSMTIMFPYCSFKCNKECGREVCHNIHLKDSDVIDMPVDEIVDRYINNPITEAIVMQGLEPFDSFDELYSLIYKFTEKSNDDIVIFTGYKEEEISDKVKQLSDIVECNTFIIKFGRFVPDDSTVFDSVLGVKLSSSNQYGKIVK